MIFVPIIGKGYPSAAAKLVAQATKNIDILMYDWRWYPDQPGHAVQQFNLEIIAAVRRGVQVRAVLNSSEIIRQLEDVGVRARVMRDRRTLHCKMLLIDGKVLVLGSHNLTRNAFAHNVEASVAVEIPEGETRFQEFFDNLYGL